LAGALLVVAGLSGAQISLTEIPSVVAAGAKWTLVWEGLGAEGVIGDSDGGLLFTQAQLSRVSKLDGNGKVSAYLENTHGARALAMDSGGRLLGAQPSAVAVLAPERKVLADNIQGQPLGGLSDLMVAKNGGVYFIGAVTYYLSPSGLGTIVGQAIRANGILLSRNEKTLYATNGGQIVAFDVEPDGSLGDPREFAKLRAGGAGGGMAIDAAGRLYVCSALGIQIIGPDGRHLGLMPAPRRPVNIAFSGPAKRTLYVVASSAAEGVPGNAQSIYKLDMVANGFAGRAK
jgi:gluconolactonase